MYLKFFTLLYVEDHQETQSLLSELLESSVQKLYVASDGEEGLELYKKYRPDIVLSDIAMPKLDGLEMSKEIKGINPSQQIALLTAFNNLEYLKEAINIKIDKYILKPMNIDSLLETLESMSETLQVMKRQKELEHMLQVQSKVASMGEMVGNIAHQWRQPLSSISSAAINMKVQLELNRVNVDDFNRYADQILKQNDYLSQTISDFRNYFREDGGAVKSFNVKDSLYNLIGLVNDSYAENNIEIIFNYEDCMLLQNENKLIQSMLNILNNAKDAFLMNEVENKIRFVFIDLRVEDNHVIVSIKDSAGGINDDILDNVCEPYFSTKHPSVGTGIGLYMSNQIISKQYKGTITTTNEVYTYNSQDLKGACFTITLPMS